MAAWDMTKKVTMTFATPASEAWQTAVHQKIQDLRAACQTDGMAPQTEGVSIREFKDQAAAEAWVAFCNNLSSITGRVITSSAISDT